MHLHSICFHPLDQRLRVVQQPLRSSSHDIRLHKAIEQCRPLGWQGMEARRGEVPVRLNDIDVQRATQGPDRGFAKDRVLVPIDREYVRDRVQRVRGVWPVARGE